MLPAFALLSEESIRGWHWVSADGTKLCVVLQYSQSTADHQSLKSSGYAAFCSGSGECKTSIMFSSDTNELLQKWHRVN
jgi:hypothetical protein